ncbi:NAD-dependent protein deacylase sirtuin-5, mitochondrial-like [Thrips palmi]|uniref:NAD-dependent protein deacylase n=1 Tax=Thrips palmi TaxID=161013 RepID=A0A6P8Y7R9_THRPL|nr:NAD-dependent protein deacylase sirtuin-5, mitochondrial-like [Thrips palmi]
MAKRVCLSDVKAFHEVFKKSKNIVVLTGAGVSAESGIPTFRGSGGFWRKYQATDLATPTAFKRDPSLVWEFYHYRREVVMAASPNKAHTALAEAERRLTAEGRQFNVVTQNVDGLHLKAGSSNVLELHGSLMKTRCLKCEDVRENRDSPICPALEGRGLPDVNSCSSSIPTEQLPRCQSGSCNGLLRPHVVWFGENLDSGVLAEAERLLSACDLCLVIGTSSVVYPAAAFAPSAAARGIPVAEFNIEESPTVHDLLSFYFKGPCGTTVPEALSV